VASPGGAQTTPPNQLYDTTQILAHTHNECGPAADCITVLAAQETVEAGAGMLVTATCPATDPFVHGWDAEQHEHLLAHLLQSKSTANAVTLAVRNVADAPRTISVYLGCSVDEDAAQGAVVLQMRGAVPSNITPGRRQ
jgi:hypothetical protein